MSAVISSCGRYRYRLDRSADGPAPFIAWIMVNPSTADADNDDATIRKVRGFSARAGFDRFMVGNLFAYRSKDVAALRVTRDPVGPDNDLHLEAIMRAADQVVAAWGPMAKLPPELRRRWYKIARIAGELRRPLLCLGTAQDGHPRHPLMVAYSTPLTPWEPPR